MMKKLLFMIGLLSMNQANAWLCEETASVRNGSVIGACGTGLGKDENEARKMALINSVSEFESICKLSDDCNNHEISVDPQRTSCESDGGNFKCHRFIKFTVGNKKDAANQEEENQSIPDQKIKKAPRVTLGMSKAEFLRRFGPPTRVIKDWGRLLIAYIDKPFCERHYCNVFVENEKISRIMNFKYAYTEDLQ